MKNKDIKEITVIGIGLLAACFAISKFSHCQFEMETDFLSAFATLFAGVIAFYLYSDWKKEHIINQIYDLNNQLKVQSSLVSSSFEENIKHVGLINGSSVSEGHKIGVKVHGLSFELYKRFSKLSALLIEYQCFLESLEQIPIVMHHIDVIKNILVTLNKVTEDIMKLSEFNSLDTLVHDVDIFYNSERIRVDINVVESVIQIENPKFYFAYLKEI